MAFEVPPKKPKLSPWEQLPIIPMKRPACIVVVCSQRSWHEKYAEFARVSSDKYIHVAPLTRYEKVMGLVPDKVILVEGDVDITRHARLLSELCMRCQRKKHSTMVIEYDLAQSFIEGFQRQALRDDLARRGYGL